MHFTSSHSLPPHPTSHPHQMANVTFDAFYRSQAQPSTSAYASSSSSSSFSARRFVQPQNLPAPASGASHGTQSYAQLREQVRAEHEAYDYARAETEAGAQMEQRNESTGSSSMLRQRSVSSDDLLPEAKRSRGLGMLDNVEDENVAKYGYGYGHERGRGDGDDDDVEVIVTEIEEELERRLGKDRNGSESVEMEMESPERIEIPTPVSASPPAPASSAGQRAPNRLTAKALKAVRSHPIVVIQNQSQSQLQQDQKRPHSVSVSVSPPIPIPQAPLQGTLRDPEPVVRRHTDGGVALSASTSSSVSGGSANVGQNGGQTGQSASASAISWADAKTRSLIGVTCIAIESLWGKQSPADPSSSPDSSNSVLALHWFVAEVLRRSRSQIASVQLALYYLHKSRYEIRTFVARAAQEKADLANGVTKEERERRERDAGLYPSPPQSPLTDDADGEASSSSSPSSSTSSGSPLPGTLLPPDLSAHLSTSSSPLLCGRRMFLAALMVASKYLQDRNYSNRAWSKISGLPVEEVNLNERVMLCVLKWEMHMKGEGFESWIVRLDQLAHYGAKMASKSSSSSTTATCPTPISKSSSSSQPQSSASASTTRSRHRKPVLRSNSSAAASATSIEDDGEKVEDTEVESDDDDEEEEEMGRRQMRREIRGLRSSSRVVG